MPQSPDRIVSVEWLANHAGDDTVVVDVRPEEQYNAAHIPGARNVDIYPYKILDSDQEAIDQWIETMQGVFRNLGVHSGDHVVFYEDISGTSAARGVWLMELLSIGHGSMLDGGLMAWHAEGKPLSNDPVSVEPSNLEVRLDTGAFATAPEIMREIEQPSGACIIDTRNLLEWKRGTIPSARHIEWASHLHQNGKFKPMDELRVLYDDLGAAPGDGIITFCASGYRAAHTWLVLSELGYDNVKNYAPSWGEWGHRADVPVEHP